MGLLNRMLGGKDSKRLIYIIKKTNNLPEGIFANINNDLNGGLLAYTDGDINNYEETIHANPLLFMAYAYARRTAAAGLFLQGVFDRENYLRASRIFTAFQVNTYHTTNDHVGFQEEAANQAGELLSSYDSRLDKKVIAVITTMVEANLTSVDKANQIHSSEAYGKKTFPYEMVITAAQMTFCSTKTR